MYVLIEVPSVISVRLPLLVFSFDFSFSFSLAFSLSFLAFFSFLALTGDNFGGSSSESLESESINSLDLYEDILFVYQNKLLTDRLYLSIYLKKLVCMKQRQKMIIIFEEVEEKISQV